MIIGIDLGTTNCAVGVWRDGRAELIPNSLGHVLTPSAVSLDGDGNLLVGLQARERQSTHPSLTATAFKRYMGSGRRTKIGTQDLLPEELSALVLARLKADAEAFLGTEVTEAVITVPAYFNDRQRKATRRAGELAGLKVERLLNEPTAAALAYGIHELEDESQFLVFDLGGGTFDVSILEIFESVIEVRASTGDNRLGGEDFNAVLIEDMKVRFGKAWGGDVSNDALFQRLRVAAERARRMLTEQPAAEVQIAWKDRLYDYAITADAFEARAAELLNRLREPVLRSLRDSDIQIELLREIVLVGGATRMPAVRRAVTRMFGRFPAATVHPDEAVALGAAVQAGLKARDASLSEVVLTDVCPYTLGVETAHRRPNGSLRQGVFSPIIERNTVVPASRVDTFTTMQAGQRSVVFKIYQGESLHAVDNIHLGRIEIPVPPRPAGQISIDCRFSYDVNGLIEVDIDVPETSEHRQLVIIDGDDLSEAELGKRREALALLKQLPRDSDANRAAISRAERCYENFIGYRRERIAQAMAAFESVLYEQDPRAADHAREKLLAMLDELEGETYL